MIIAAVSFDWSIDSESGKNMDSKVSNPKCWQIYHGAYMFVYGT